MALNQWSPIDGGIATPNGFQASGISAGLKASAKSDLALLLAPQGSVCAGTFTQSLVRASCIDICRDRLKANFGKARAVLVNSGQANACTGEQGHLHAQQSSKEIADALGLNIEEILISSTGVIGDLIPIEKLLSAIPLLVKSLNRDGGGSSAAEAILTTDLVKKEIAIEKKLNGRLVRIGGMAKGSGMIHPNMATMLAYITCDVGVPFDLWSGMIKRVASSSFNSITVDGDTSTNDTFLAFNAGEPLDKIYLDDLESGLNYVAKHLAKSIARDGEGASCLIEVKVNGASSQNDAHKIARTICSSSLVKTAINGGDPNWGRIVAAAARAGVFFKPNDLALWIGPYQLMQEGSPIKFDRKATAEYINSRKGGVYLKDDTVVILLDIGTGSYSALAWGCDLSDQYVRINSEYTT